MPKRFPKDADVRIAEEIGKRKRSQGISWNIVAEIAIPICGVKPSRQWLATNAILKTAFEAFLRGADVGEGQEKKKPFTRVQSLEDQIRKLRAELERRDRLLAEFDERLMKYLKWARVGGLTQECLEQPLEPVVRGAGRKRSLEVKLSRG